ncbi:MAG: bacillithiol biosynthesis BshC, partial [Gemmatimonadota bacterium]|nr:bacillithiol biosynthesis BshC [Gemmatimonadota bacterium]
RQEDNGGKGKKKFRLKRSGKTLSEGQIRGMLEESLSMFSPGVLLRPLVESSMLGTLCYVAGPGEIAYYAQMGELYHLRGLRMPIIYPRLGGILIEPGINRILDKLGIGAESLEAGAEALAGQLLAQAKNSSLAPALEELEQLRSIAGQRLAGIAKRVKKIDPSLDGPLSRTERSISGNIDRLAAKITAAAGRGDKTLLSRLNRAALNLWPGGMPQERRFASVYFLAQYGRHLLDFLLDQVRPELDG